jgi:hypothetical protein
MLVHTIRSILGTTSSESHRTHLSEDALAQQQGHAGPPPHCESAFDCRSQTPPLVALAPVKPIPLASVEIKNPKPTQEASLGQPTRDRARGRPPDLIFHFPRVTLTRGDSTQRIGRWSDRKEAFELKRLV